MEKKEKKKEWVIIVTWLVILISVAWVGAKWYTGERLWETGKSCQSYVEYGCFDCYNSLIENCTKLTDNPWVEQCDCLSQNQTKTCGTEMVMRQCESYLEYKEWKK